MNKDNDTPTPVKTPVSVKAPTKKAEAPAPASEAPAPAAPTPEQTTTTKPPVPEPQDPWGLMAEQGSETSGYYTRTEGLQTAAGVLIRDTVRITNADGTVSASSSIIFAPRGSILRNNNQGRKAISV